MTQEEQLQYIAQCCDAFKNALLVKASRIPKNWDYAEIQQWIVDAAKEHPVTMTMDKNRMRKYQITRQVQGL